LLHFSEHPSSTTPILEKGEFTGRQVSSKLDVEIKFLLLCKLVVRINGKTLICRKKTLNHGFLIWQKLRTVAIPKKKSLENLAVSDFSVQL
jgi:macrodomain Ter protein organizer (MatP/YcbG family)